MKTLFFIGGTSFLGSEIINSLSPKDYKIIVLTRNEKNAEKFSHTIENIEFVIGSLSDIDIMESTIEDYNVDIIFHLASNLIPVSSKEDFRKELANIIYPSFELIQLVSILQKKLIYFSSGGTVYKNTKKRITESSSLEAKSYYGKSKLMVEKEILSIAQQATPLDFVILRPSNVYGRTRNINSRQGFIENSILQILKGEPIVIWGDGKQMRDYVHISDLVYVVKQITSKGFSQEVLNVASGQSVSLIDIVNLLTEIMEQDLSITYKTKRDSGVDKISFNTQHLKSCMAYDPIPIRQGIDSLIKEMKS